MVSRGCLRVTEMQVAKNLDAVHLRGTPHPPKLRHKDIMGRRRHHQRRRVVEPQEGVRCRILA